jgi:hypothetical protein
MRSAADLLSAHDALVAVTNAEPDAELDAEGWVSWHDRDYKPTYKRWSAAMDAFAVAYGEPRMSRHPANFRPLCERLMRPK